jgi:L-lactate dehydrogenase complex protein LldG
VSDLISAFTRSLDRLDVAWIRTPPDAFPGELEKLVEPPVIGCPFPFSTVQLPDSYRTDELTPRALEKAQTGVSGALLGIASHGSIVLPHGESLDEPVSLFGNRHVAVVRTSDVVADLETAFERLGPRIVDRRRGAVLATGPSATADMGALVKGAHGPRSVHVIIVDEP